MRSTYLLIDLFTILVPFIFSFHRKIRFNRQWGKFFPAMIFTAIIFIVWDAYFTKIGVWNFNPKYTTGINLGQLPVEEILFFICVPYSCVFTYYCLTKFYKMDWPATAVSVSCIIIAAFLLITGLINVEKLYTSVTFISTAVILLVQQFYFKVKWMGKAITVYIILLIPFLIVNGLLTGTGLNEAVVRYNANENLGVRILTIPFEDIFYGFELFLLNLGFYLGRTKTFAIHFRVI